MIKSLFWFFQNQWASFKALSLLQKTLMLYHWWHQDSCYNPLSQNSEHGLPTEKRDREVDWFEVTGHDHSRSFSIWENFKRRGRGDGERRSRMKWRYRELTSGDRTWGNTINHEEGKRMLHDSDPVLLRGSRVDGESVTVGEEGRGRGGGGRIWGY